MLVVPNHRGAVRRISKKSIDFSNIYSTTFPFGHLYSRDTSIKGTQDYTQAGTKHFFWVPKPGFHFHRGDILALKT